MRKTVNIIAAGLLSGAFILLGVFVFEPSYRRFWEALCDLGRSVGYYFCELFGIAHTIEPTVTKYSAVMQWSVRFPVDFEGFIASAGDYFTLLFSKDNFTAWGKSLSVTLGNTAKVISVLLPPCDGKGMGKTQTLAVSQAQKRRSPTLRVRLQTIRRRL